MVTRGAAVSKRPSERYRPAKGDVETPFWLLKNARRRRVLRVLRNRVRASIEALTRYVADAEFRTYTEPEWRQVYASLSQTHLPRLDSDGLVEYDRTNGEVAIGEETRFDRVTTALAKVRFLEPDADARELDRLFGVLDDERRRLVIRILYQNRNPIAITDVARELASIEEGVPPDEVTQRQQKRRYLALYRSVLPRLTRHGTVRRDDAGEIALRNLDERVYYLLYGRFFTATTRLRWKIRRSCDRTSGDHLTRPT